MTETTNARIIYANGPDAGKEVELTHDVTTLGRASSCQVVIIADFVSRRHAQIIQRDEVYWIRDLGSKNGTLLDGQPVDAEERLTDGVTLQIGDRFLRFYDTMATRTYAGVETQLAAISQPFQIIEAAREVRLDGQRLDPPLSPKQFDLLLCLWQRRGEAVSKDEIAAAVWPEAAQEGIYNYQIDKMISRLRERLGKESIETVWGFGFKLVL